MAESLYVCSFSTGHIKVGRSVDPLSRIASHAERVSCIGVDLVDHYVTGTPENAAARESILIGLCTGAADRRFKSEWFSGLNYTSVCVWAAHAASCELPEESRDSFGYRLMEARKQAGLSQADLGRGLRSDGGDLQKAAVSAWEVGRSSPDAKQLPVICERLAVSADYLLGRSDKQNPR